jgi:hypothetical protein
LLSPLDDLARNAIWKELMMDAFWEMGIATNLGCFLVSLLGMNAVGRL